MPGDGLDRRKVACPFRQTRPRGVSTPYHQEFPVGLTRLIQFFCIVTFWRRIPMLPPVHRGNGHTHPPGELGLCQTCDFPELRESLRKGVQRHTHSMPVIFRDGTGFPRVFSSLGKTRPPLHHGRMDDIRTPTTSETETAVLALCSALRRRGVAAAPGDLPGSVRAEHAGRRVTVRLLDRRWWRPMPDGPRTTVAVARSGDEDSLARDLVSELLGRP